LKAHSIHDGIEAGWSVEYNKEEKSVSMGAKVDLQSSLKIGYSGIPSIVDLNTSIEVNQNTANANGIKVKTYNNSINAFSIEAYTGGTNNFIVYGDGKTFIGKSKQLSAGHTGAMLSVNGDIVIGTGSSANIWVTQSNWSDFVFDTNYHPMDITELETFYKTNHHLPNVPSTKDIQENGNNLGQTDAILLQKIEELTLYLVEQQKQINALKELLKNK
jgi:hypothetical protein